jgi:Tol biopolymer transport system component
MLSCAIQALGERSMDGHRIAYSTTTGLFTVRSDGTDTLRLLAIGPGTGEQIYWPRWSTDAEQLRYSLYDPGTGKHLLWEASANGAGAHALLPDWNSAANACCGSWTTDGRFFVFAATQNGRSDIWAIPNRTDLLSQTSLQPVQVTAGPKSFSTPLPAADGNIYVAGTETRGELARWHAESGSLTAWFSGASVIGVTSTRDGQWIAYTSFPDRALWRSRIDGSEKLQLTLPPMDAYLPRWSPDGRQIAFYARAPGPPFQIYTVSADGGAPQRPVPSDQQQIDPGWSKTGTELMYESDPWQKRGKERKTQIEIVDLQS